MRDMFARIAPRYDFITRVFSYGMDRRWKRLAVDQSSLPSGGMILDLACGTGDFSRLIREHDATSRTVAADLTESMLRLAAIPDAVCADAASLPFRPAAFDAVFIGYGLRNFPTLASVLQEVHRVIGCGGMLVSLDFFLPRNTLLRILYLSYLYLQGAFWGLLLHGRPRIYTYIPASLRTFLTAEEFSSLLRKSGFADVETRTFLFGGIALHWAKASARDIR
jgi:demethylmenaquinone methyltransferase/2-methoxy-6-polyprenyl-1,4-benzoquinol methylase